MSCPRFFPGLLAVLTLAALATTPVPAREFPPITDQERALTELPSDPGAPAVVLFEQAELRIMNYPREVSSFLEVQVRLKILTEEGKEYGEVAILHSAYHRLKDFEGRTVLADGREVPLPEEAIFRERSSRARKRFVTKAVFPAVEVGAIIDYRYTKRWDDMFYLEPWYFSNRIPTLVSEIRFVRPDNMSVHPWAVKVGRRDFQVAEEKTPRGSLIRIRMEDLPAIPDEPLSFPFADLTTQFMAVPKEVFVSGNRVGLLDSWETVCEIYANHVYALARRNDGRAKKLAARLAAGASGRRDKIAALYAFVRDEVRTLPSPWVGVSDDSSVDRVLEEKQGRGSEKALLLQAMLDAVKVKSRLVWVADRSLGRIYPELPNPWWFDHVLVMVDLDGERLFLDPGDRGLAPGRLAPNYEGMPALVFHRKKPEVITLPATPFDQSTRQATVDLALDEEGRLTGRGALVLHGHHAWRYLGWGRGEEEITKFWKEWLENKFKDYEIGEVEIEEEVGEQRFRVAWTLTQREEEVLGDETSLKPSRPLGPVAQPLDLPPERRLTPVRLSFADRDEVAMTLVWPEDWEIDLLPQGADYEGPAGALRSQVEVDTAGRRLTYRRQFDVTGTEFIGPQNYVSIRSLYGEVEKHDAQNLVLVRR